MKIKSIEIKQLLNIVSPKIELIDNLVIIHGANGTGKTLILMMINALFNGNLSLVFYFVCSEIIIIFQDDTVLTIKKENFTSQNLENITNLDEVIMEIKYEHNKIILTQEEIDSIYGRNNIKSGYFNYYSTINFQLKNIDFPDEALNDPNLGWYFELIRKIKIYIYSEFSDGPQGIPISSIPLSHNEVNIILFCNILNSYIEKDTIFEYRTTDSSYQVLFTPGLTRFFSDSHLNIFSLGERRLYHLFYNLIFTYEDNSTILIDEISSSFQVSWQEKLLDTLMDIVKVKNYSLIIVTHSPQFISHYWDKTILLGETDEE